MRFPLLQKHLHIQYLPNLYVSILQSHFQLCFSGFCIRGELVQQLPWVKTWKDARMRVYVCHLWAYLCSYMLQLVCKFSQECSSEWVYIPQINSLTACTLWLSLLRYALLMVAVIIKNCWMLAASAQDTLQHNLHVFLLFWISCHVPIFLLFWHAANIRMGFHCPKSFLSRLPTQNNFLFSDGSRWKRNVYLEWMVYRIMSWF